MAFCARPDGDRLEVEIGRAGVELRLVCGAELGDLRLDRVVLLADLLARLGRALLGGLELVLAVLELGATVLERLARLAELLERVGASAVECLYGAESGEELLGVAAAEQVDGRAERRVHLLLDDRGAELFLLLVVGDQALGDVVAEVVDLVLGLLGADADLVDLLVHRLDLVQRGLDALDGRRRIGLGRREREQRTDDCQR